MTGPVPASHGLAGEGHDCHWYLVHARPRQEHVAAEHLERQGYAVYLPRLRLPRLRRSRWHDSLEPLFPRYLFAGVRGAEQSVHPIRSTRGVAALVRYGDRYRPVPHQLIASLRARADAEGLHHLHPAELAQGDRVRIVAGPFAGLEAVFQQRQGGDRVRVLLEIIGAAISATLPVGLVVPVLHDRWAAA
jgi:transcriptional antiterminator RfaH